MESVLQEWYRGEDLVAVTGTEKKTGQAESDSSAESSGDRVDVSISRTALTL